VEKNRVDLKKVGLDTTWGGVTEDKRRRTFEALRFRGGLGGVSGLTQKKTRSSPKSAQHEKVNASSTFWKGGKKWGTVKSCVSFRGLGAELVGGNAFKPRKGDEEEKSKHVSEATLTEGGRENPKHGVRDRCH